MIGKAQISAKISKKYTIMFVEGKKESQTNVIAYGDVVDGRWRIHRVLGEGAFGTVYKVDDLKNPKHFYAMKIEKNSFTYRDERRKPCDIEVIVMKNLRNKSAKCYPAYKSSGCYKNVYSYIVMELLGKNLMHLMFKLPDHRFTLGTCLHIGRQSLISIEELHRAGFLHRDIKPSNFAVSKSDPTKLYILDFGCCREYLTVNGNHKPARSPVLFSGTPRYASSNVLDRKDWGRVDDMWSWFFSLIELTTGQLPWDKDDSRPSDELLYLSWLTNKKRLLLQDSASLLVGCPIDYVKIYNHLISLKFDDKPRYRSCFNILNDIAEKNGFLEGHHLLDWQNNENMNL